MPHLYLDELRIDQGGEASGKVQASLRLSMVYQVSAEQRVDLVTRKGLR
jgi:hypothetical protein